MATDNQVVIDLDRHGDENIGDIVLERVRRQLGKRGKQVPESLLSEYLKVEKASTSATTESLKVCRDEHRGVENSHQQNTIQNQFEESSFGMCSTNALPFDCI